MRPTLSALLPATVVLAIFGSLACGVRFGSPDPETELFEDIEISGTRTAGSPLTITLGITQAYPVAVQIACYYDLADRDLTDDEKALPFEERATKVGERTLPASPGTEPGDEVDAVEVTFPFSINEPGRYFLACLTPSAPDNGVGTTFTVRQR